MTKCKLKLIKTDSKNYKIEIASFKLSFGFFWRD